MLWTKSVGSWLNVTFGKSFMICLATRNLEKLTPLFPSSASTYLRTCTSFARVSLPSRFLPSSPEYSSSPYLLSRLDATGPPGDVAAEGGRAACAGGRAEG